MININKRSNATHHPATPPNTIGSMLLDSEVPLLQRLIIAILLIITIPLQSLDGTEEQEQSQESLPRNRKNRALRQLTTSKIKQAGIRAANDQVYQWIPNEQRFAPLDRPETAITEILGDDVQDMSVRDVRDTLEMVRQTSDCQIQDDEVNCYETCVNCESGVLDWTTGKTYRPSAGLPYTYQIKAQYLGKGDILSTPAFDQFCISSLGGNPSKRKLLLEIIGYCLSDSIAGKCAMFLKGVPNSGKSILLAFITRLLPEDQVVSVPLHKLDDEFYIIRLQGAKLCVCGEIKGSPLRSIESFKKTTGGDLNAGAHKGKDPVFFRTRCKLLYAGNSLPGTTESDATNAFVNRLIVLLFNRSIPKEEQDKDLLEKLWQERDAIFTLAMRALKELQERNYNFTMPEDSKDYLDHFNERTNSLHAFIKDMCVLEDDASIFNADLMDAYSCYCRANGLDEFSRTRVYELLDGLPGVHAKRIRREKKNLRGHAGIRLKHPDEM